MNFEEKRLRVFVVRHGQTDHNIQRILQGHLDVLLNNEGRLQASKLGQAMKMHKWDAVLTSDLERCQETLQILMEGNEGGYGAVTVSAAMRERMMGDVQGMKVVDAQILYGDSFKDQGESYDEMRERVMAQWHEFMAHAVESQFTNVLVVTHGGVIRCLIRELGGGGVVPFNTSVSVVEIASDSNAEVTVIGDVSHLNRDPAAGGVDQLAL